MFQLKKLHFFYELLLSNKKEGWGEIWFLLTSWTKGRHCHFSLHYKTPAAEGEEDLYLQNIITHTVPTPCAHTSALRMPLAAVAVGTSYML